MNELKLKGLCIEDFRIKHNLIIQQMIDKKHRICDYKTYQKVIHGECQIEQIYEDLLEMNKILYDYDEQLNAILNEIAYKMRYYLSRYEISWIQGEIKKTLRQLEAKMTIYPYGIFYECIDMFYKYHFYKETCSEVTLKRIQSFVDYFSYDLKICYYFLNYAYVHNKAEEDEIVFKAVDMIPENLYEDESILRILMITSRYKNDMEKSLYYANILEEKCLKTDNINMLLLVFNNKHAVYKYLEEKENYQYYWNKMIEFIHNDLIQPTIKESLLYYMGMNAFDEHDFTNARDLYKSLLNINAQRYQKVILPYLHIMQNIDEKESKFLLTIIRNQSEMRKLETKFFSMKLQKKKKKTLIDYIVKKVLPILSGDNYFDYHIFMEELYWLDSEIYFKEMNKIENIKFKINSYWKYYLK